MRKAYKGFTLIELMVVIAIIGLLSSIVIVAVNQARLKSRDSTIQQQTRELAKLFELQYRESQNYSALAAGLSTDTTQTGTAAASCESTTAGVSYTGPFATKAIEICKAIINAQESAGVSAYLRVGGNLGSPAGQKFSVTARKASVSNEFFCYGTGGKNSEGIADPDGNGTSWESPGCQANP